MYTDREVWYSESTATKGHLMTATATATATATLVYTTCTCGMTPHWDHCERYVAPALVAEWDEEDDEYAYSIQYCFVCGRCTDHVGEHDELVIAGLAAYDGYDVKASEGWYALRALEDEVAGVIAYALRWDA